MSWDSGLWWPYGNPITFITGSASALDGTGEYCAFIGKISIAGKATNKTLDTTGSSSIRFSVGAAPVFDNAGSVFTVGFQGVDKTTGFPVRPNGTWSARAVITTAANSTPTLTTTSTTGHVIVPTAGTITLSHGDEVCFVYEMTTRAGTDSITPTGSYSKVAQYPAVITNVSGSPAGLSSVGAAVIVTFSDGTLGTILGNFLPGQSAALTWADATNPDEVGGGFRFDSACTIDAVAFPLRLVDATSDAQFDIVSDYLGTPTSLIGGPIALTAENLSVAASEVMVFYEFASDVSMAAATDYVVALKATGAGNIRFTQLTLADAAHRIFVGPGGTTMFSTTRNGGSGAYGAADTTLLNPFSVRISGFAAGGGLLTHPGMTGGMRG